METLMKPGIRTTEFWLALIVALLGAFASIYAEGDWAKVAGMVAAALASAGYGFARSSVKRTAPMYVINNKDDLPAGSARKATRAREAAK